MEGEGGEGVVEEPRVRFRKLDGGGLGKEEMENKKRRRKEVHKRIGRRREKVKGISVRERKNEERERKKNTLK